MYACLAVTCHLHFWQNDRDFLRATVVTRGWNGYRNKSQHRKSTLEKKILPPFQQGFEPATFQSRVRCSNHYWVNDISIFYIYIFFLNVLSTSLSLTGNSGHHTQLRHSSWKSSATNSYQHLQFLFCPNNDMAGTVAVSGIFNMHTDVNASNSTLGLCRHRKGVCTESWPGRKIPCHTRDLNLHQHYDWLLSGTLCQLSCPAPFTSSCTMYAASFFTTGP